MAREVGYINNGGSMIIRLMLIFVFSLVTAKNTLVSTPCELDNLMGCSLLQFTMLVKNGDGDVVRGVFIPEVLVLPVVQQPPEDNEYVSDNLGELTQFRLAANRGVIGLLAHNTLSGKLFSNIEDGAVVAIVYGDGRIRWYRIKGRDYYQVFKISDDTFKYLNLNDDELLDIPETFYKFYSGKHHVTFQTCLEGEGVDNWGRIFITAEPIVFIRRPLIKR